MKLPRLSYSSSVSIRIRTSDGVIFDMISASTFFNLYLLFVNEHTGVSANSASNRVLFSRSALVKY